MANILGRLAAASLGWLLLTFFAPAFAQEAALPSGFAQQVRASCADGDASSCVVVEALDKREFKEFGGVLDGVVSVSDFIWGGTWPKTATGTAALEESGLKTSAIAKLSALPFEPQAVVSGQLLPFPPMVIILLGSGIFFMIRLGFYPVLKLPAAFAGLFKKEEGGKGEISPFAALSTALSGQIGTGNITGVATAITLGGPGALFWMWVTALLGMALAFAEGSLAVRFRDVDANGHYRGGPMTYIRRGLGKKWGWLSILFCIGTLLSAISTGCMIQANGVADAITGIFPLADAGAPIENAIGTPAGSGGEIIAGIIVAALVFVVIIGGIKSIGNVAEKIVPAMAAGYILMAVVAIILNISDVPAAFGTIFASAFTGHAATGGFVGAGIILAIRSGVARGLFSNEAGQGSTPMAHAVAQTNDPARQGRFAMMGTFIDTIIVCTMTGLVILTVQGAFPSTAGVQEHAWTSDLQGFEMTSAAFGTAFSFPVLGIPLGTLVASVALALFVFTTLVTWSYYGERAATYLFGHWAEIPWRVVWCLMIVVGSFQNIEVIWKTGDLFNAMMIFPNVIALIALSGVVVALAKGDRTAGVDHGDDEGQHGPAPAAASDPV